MIEAALGGSADFDGLAKALWVLRPETIDEFLSQGSEKHRPLGKTLIASVLRSAERKLVSEDLLNPPPDWYISLNLLSLKYRIAVATFNYERSLQWGILRRRHAEAYRDQTTFPVNLNFPVHHVHGTLGATEGKETEWWDSLGHDLTPESLRHAAESIAIVGEEKADVEFARVRALVNEVEVVVFVGFGFDHRNFSRLGIKDALAHRRVSIGATCLNPRSNLQGMAGRMIGADTTWFEKEGCCLEAVQWARNQIAVLEANRPSNAEQAAPSGASAPQVPL